MSDTPENIAESKCEACRAGAPQLTGAERESLMPQIPDWEVVHVDDSERLRREFEFDDFAQALAFVGKVGAAAEEEEHHPLIVLEWGKVQVDWWTHKIGGLHKNDVIMAARTDALYKSE